MDEPYIFSSLSKRVTERVFGGLMTFALAVALGFSSSDSAPESADSSSLLFLLSGSVGLPGVLVFLPVDRASFRDFEECGRERTVGGNCRGSPARINFLPLMIGIQQAFQTML